MLRTREFLVPGQTVILLRHPGARRPPLFLLLFVLDMCVHTLNMLVEKFVRAGSKRLLGPGIRGFDQFEGVLFNRVDMTPKSKVSTTSLRLASNTIWSGAI